MLKKISLSFFLLFFLLSGFAWAATSALNNNNQSAKPTLEITSIFLKGSALRKGYTFSTFKNNFKIGIFPFVLREPTALAAKKYLHFDFPLPPNKKLISPLYEFNIINKKAYNNKRPLIIEIKYNAADAGYKSAYYWNNLQKKWEKTKSDNLTGRHIIRFRFYLPYAKVAVFENRNVLTTGVASWYSYKGCDCAASPDYPKGTRLKVTNLQNGKSVIVLVNDYGPERDKFPNRIIDLDKVAFAKIANLRQGLCEVRVEPVKNSPVTANDNSKQFLASALALKKPKHPIKPPTFPLHSRAVIVINAKNGAVLFAKNPQERLPIASITKLMSIKVFLDTHPNFNKIVRYARSDDDVLKYAPKWELAYLYVHPGETMRVKDLFYAALVGSANNAVYALARSTGLRRIDFVHLMNKEAQKLGMTRTTYVEPSGLSPRNQSTVSDLAKLGRVIFNNFKVLQASTAKKYVFRTLNTHHLHIIYNRNKILYSDLYVLGTKTGFLDEAGHCLIVKVKDKENNQIIVVTLGDFSRNPDDYFTETERLAHWGLKVLENQK